MRDKTTVLPGIGAVALLIKSQGDDAALLILPLAGQDTSIFGSTSRQSTDGRYRLVVTDRGRGAGGARQERQGQHTQVPFQTRHTTFIPWAGSACELRKILAH